MHRTLLRGTRLAIAEPTDVIRVLWSPDHRVEEHFEDLVEALPLRRCKPIDNIAEQHASLMHVSARAFAAELGQPESHHTLIGTGLADDQVRRFQLVDEANRRRVGQTERPAERAVRASLGKPDHVQGRGGRTGLVRMPPAVPLQATDDLHRERPQQISGSQLRHSFRFLLARCD